MKIFTLYAGQWSVPWRWRGLISAVPRVRQQTLRAGFKREICNAHGLSGLGNWTNLAGTCNFRANPSTKEICKMFTSRIFIHPTAQTKFNQEFGIMKDEWKNIYSLPYQCSMEVRTRIFNIKLIWIMFMLISRHPSVNTDDGLRPGGGLSSLLQLRLWLRSPILAWQSLPQLLQTYGEGADTGVGAATRNFLLCLFSCSKEVRLSSAWLTPVATGRCVPVQLPPSCWGLCQPASCRVYRCPWIVGMGDQLAWSLMKVRHKGLLLDWSQLASILWTWPNHLRRRWLNMVNMLVEWARSRTSVFGTFSCHVMPKMRCRQRRWKLITTWITGMAFQKVSCQGERWQQ